MTQTCICGSDHDVSERVFNHSLIFSDLRVSGSSSSERRTNMLSLIKLTKHILTACVSCHAQV